jgi:hypothetical protein
MSTSYLMKLRCTDCGTRFKRTVQDIDEDNPPCPKCSVQKANIGLDIAAGLVPSIGGSPAVRAMDFTMETVAQEYGFTDLRTDARPGETMTPKLPPAQQAIADSMFNPTLRKKQMGNTPAGRKLGQIAATAYAGGYKQPDRDPVALLHKDHRQGERVKANFVAGDGVTVR